jgi:hypothetical protein
MIEPPAPIATGNQLVRRPAPAHRTRAQLGDPLSKRFLAAARLCGIVIISLGHGAHPWLWSGRAGCRKPPGRPYRRSHHSLDKRQA